MSNRSVTPPSGIRRTLLWAAIPLLWVAAVVTVEIGARLAGARPREAVAMLGTPLTTVDPVLGWRPIPGRYQIGPFAIGARAATVTVGPDGTRATGGGPRDGRPPLVFLGCSFTLGWAVGDDETFAWRVQSLRPDLAVENHGVGGYGTTQSLLLLEELLGQGARPALVLYGDIGHERRNVAAPSWLLALRSNQAAVATPYATLDAAGGLARHPPEGYPALPLDTRLAAVTLLEDALARRRPYADAGDPHRVTELLVQEMADRAGRAEVGFSLVILSLPEEERAARLAFARAHGIDVIDCHLTIGPELMVPGEGHPNAEAHRRWGDCIAAALAEPSRVPRRAARSAPE